MKCSQYVERNLKDTSIHGLPYLMRDDLHWWERIFWLAIILSATYYSIHICLNQWIRFRDNPIVYAMELTWYKRDFPYAGITVCANFYEEKDMEEIINQLWGLTPNDTKFEYYSHFLLTLNTLRIDNLDILTPYHNDSSLRDIKLLETLIKLQNHILPAPVYHINDTIQSDLAPGLTYHQLTYAAAITEAGLCRTTFQLNEYTNPYGINKRLLVSEVHYCGFMSECNSKIVPFGNDDTGLNIYLHNIFDVPSPSHRSTVFREAKPGGSLSVELLLSWTAAEEEVRNLPILNRRCRYDSENNLEYFQTYRPNFCRMECRINAAMKMCNCKPFFYAVASHLPLCTVDGMLCLAAKNWSMVACDCFPLCEEISYTGLQSMNQHDETNKFERTIIIKLFLPYMAPKRRVVFSTDQLVVAFGGAVGLFLGASFISVYTIIKLLGEFVFLNCQQCCKARRKRRVEGRMQGKSNI